MSLRMTGTDVVGMTDSSVMMASTREAEGKINEEKNGNCYKLHFSHVPGVTS